MTTLSKQCEHEKFLNEVAPDIIHHLDEIDSLVVYQKNNYECPAEGDPIEQIPWFSTVQEMKESIQGSTAGVLRRLTDDLIISIRFNPDKSTVD